MRQARRNRMSLRVDQLVLPNGPYANTTDPAAALPTSSTPTTATAAGPSPKLRTRSSPATRPSPASQRSSRPCSAASTPHWPATPAPALSPRLAASLDDGTITNAATNCGDSVRVISPRDANKPLTAAQVGLPPAADKMFARAAKAGVHWLPTITCRPSPNTHRSQPAKTTNSFPQDSPNWSGYEGDTPALNYVQMGLGDAAGRHDGRASQQRDLAGVGTGPDRQADPGWHRAGCPVPEWWLWWC
jgi:hypothetical protein